MRTTLLLLALSTACGQPPEVDPPDPPPPPPPDRPRFVAEAGEAPALRLLGTLGSELTVELWADGLGSVFGIAGRIEFDPEHLEVSSAELAPELLGDAAELLRTDADSVAFGFARKGPALGDATLDGTVRLATVRFQPRRAGDSMLRLTRAMVRRSDGGFVSAALLGADVHTVGGGE